MQTPLLIINPDSGSHTGRRVAHVVAEISRMGSAPRVVSVRTPSEAALYFRSIAAAARHPLIIVAAGDGTFNAVLNCIEAGRATLAVLPLGTSNVLATELGIGSLEEGLARIAAGRTRPFSIGVLEMEGSSRRFALMAGIGLDGAVVRDVAPLGKRLLKQGAFALSALRNCLGWELDTIEAVTPAGNLACHTAVVCNASRYGGDFILAPDESPFSTGFTLACVMGADRRTYLRLARDLFRGRVAKNGDLLRMPVSAIEIRGRKPIQIDGDFVGYAPARVTAVADFARIIV